jgi:hypothetical protein
LMVTPGLAVWNDLIQASEAASCDEAPDPLSVPERSLVVSPAAGASSLAAQPLKSMVPAMAMAATLPKRLKFDVAVFTGFPSGMFRDYRMRAGADPKDDAMRAGCPDSCHEVNGRLTSG